MGETEEVYRCQKCGAADFRAFIRYGSYAEECRHCNEAGLATSFMAVAPLFEGVYRAAVIDDNWREVQFVAEGRMSDIEEAISKVADTGKRVHLTVVDG